MSTYTTKVYEAFRFDKEKKQFSYSEHQTDYSIPSGYSTQN